MITAIDTNILSIFFSTGSSTLSDALQEARGEGALVMSGVVYAELLAGPYITESLMQQLLAQTGIHVEFSLAEDVWTLAGLRYGQYAARRRESVKESPRRLIADFVIGAHACLRADRLMTLDSRWYRQDFPELRLFPVVQ